jgi:hypothetical protein
VTTRLELFTIDDLVLVVGFLAVCVLLALLGRRHRGTSDELTFRRAFAVHPEGRELGIPTHRS